MKASSKWSWRTLWPGTHPSRTAQENCDCEAHKVHRRGWNMLSRHSWCDGMPRDAVSQLLMMTTNGIMLSINIVYWTSVKSLGEIQSENAYTYEQEDSSEQTVYRRVIRSNALAWMVVREAETCWWLVECQIDVRVGDITFKKPRQDWCDRNRPEFTQPAFATFSTGVILAVFHCCGTTAAAVDQLYSSAMDAAKTKAPECRNQASMLSRPHCRMETI